MSREPEFSEIDLHRYLDGEMAPEERQAFERWLEGEPEAAEALAHFREDRDCLREILAPVLEAPVPERLVQAAERLAARSEDLQEGLQSEELVDRGAGTHGECPPHADGRRVRGQWGGWQQIAMAILIFVAGTSLGLFVGSNAEPAATSRLQIAKRAIDAHTVYVSEVRHPVEVGANEKAHLVAWLSKRLGARLVAPDLSRQGFRLVGGRLLPSDDKPAALLMYENEAAERLTLYIVGNLENRQTAFRLSQRGEVKSFYWLDGPLAYALSGAIGRRPLLAIANTVYRQING